MNTSQLLKNLTPALCMTCFIFGSCMGHHLVPELQSSLAKANDTLAKSEENMRLAFECGVSYGGVIMSSRFKEALRTGDFSVLTNSVIEAVYKDPTLPSFLRKTKP